MQRYNLPSDFDNLLAIFLKCPSMFNGVMSTLSSTIRNNPDEQFKVFCCYIATVSSFKLKEGHECTASQHTFTNRFNSLVDRWGLTKKSERTIDRYQARYIKQGFIESILSSDKKVTQKRKCIIINYRAIFSTIKGAFSLLMYRLKEFRPYLFEQINHEVDSVVISEKEVGSHEVQTNEQKNFDYNSNFFKRNFNEDSEEAYSLSKSLSDPLNEKKGPAALKYMALAHKHGYTFSVQYQAFLNSQRAALNTANKQIRKDERRRQYLADLNARCGIKEPTPIKPKQTENHVQPIQEKKSPEEIKHSLEQLAKVKALLGKTKATTTQKPARDNTYSKTSTNLKAKVVTEIKLNNPTSHHNYDAGSIRSGKVMSALSILPSVFDSLVPDDIDIKVTRTQEQLDTDRLRKELADKQKAIIMRMLNKEVSEPANKPVE